MAIDLKPMNEYIKAIEKELLAGNATEHTLRPALKALIEGLGEKVNATNEPKRIECGAPDFVVPRGVITIGYLEAKDVGKSLDEAEKSEQLKRYCESLSNLILTDYLEFRWYVDGERQLATLDAKENKALNTETNLVVAKASGDASPEAYERALTRVKAQLSWIAEERKRFQAELETVRKRERVALRLCEARKRLLTNLERGTTQDWREIFNALRVGSRSVKTE